jgi:hypothetical protein
MTGGCRTQRWSLDAEDWWLLSLATHGDTVTLTYTDEVDVGALPPSAKPRTITFTVTVALTAPPEQGG